MAAHEAVTSSRSERKSSSASEAEARRLRCMRRECQLVSHSALLSYPGKGRQAGGPVLQADRRRAGIARADTSEVCALLRAPRTVPAHWDERGGVPKRTGAHHLRYHLPNKVLAFGYAHQFLGGSNDMLFLRAETRRCGWALSPPHLQQAGTNPEIWEALVRWHWRQAGEGFRLIFDIFGRQLLPGTEVVYCDE